MKTLWRRLRHRAPHTQTNGFASQPEPPTLKEEEKQVKKEEEEEKEEPEQSNLDDLNFLVEYEDAEDDSPPNLAPMSARIWEPADSNHLESVQPATYSYDEGIVTNLEAGSGSSGKRSYLSIIPFTIQTIDDKTTLFVWHGTFHPAVGRRFSSIIVSCKFGKPVTSPQSSKPQVKEFAPHMAYGGSNQEQKTITWGLELPVTVPAGPVQIGVTPSGSHQVQKEVQHAFTVAGSARGSPDRDTCVWTVAENASTERGVPSELRLAALVQHSGPVQVDIDISGRTTGGYLPTHHLRPKTDASGRRKVIDPTRYKGQLHEFDFDEKRLASCLKMLGQWTGQVSGAVLEFDQAVVRP
jgi:hypothetical protein